jgi:hypothetical protein
MNHMKRWHLTLFLIAALLLVGAAGAVKPVKEPVDKIVFVHYKDAPAKPAPATDQAASYKLMGMKWATFPIAYTLNPVNAYGLTAADITRNVQAAFDAWDKVTSKGLFVSGVATRQNDVFWGPIEDRNVIAVTTVWYTRGTKQIVEADIELNSYLQWGIDSDGETGPATLANAYDVQNIVTHEAGHVCGLADLYTARSSELTMYGYGALGETKKDSLELGDIAGLQKLYGV